jgi:adenine-specific DNA-methyltransferase
MAKAAARTKTAEVLPILPAADAEGHKTKARSRQARVEIVPLPVPPPFAGRFAALTPDKLRGGYYTPKAVADWLARWALRTPHDTFLEPSCGDGAILEAGISRLLALGATPRSIPSLVQGVEITPAEAETARARAVAVAGRRAREVVETGDFFAWFRALGERRFSAALGNPPFIRYQSFPEPARGRAMTLMENVGLKPNKLTNIWVPFVVAATNALTKGGRLALVIPAELLQVSYAAQLRAFLTERFEQVGLITCNELFFEGAEQEVVLLLAEGAIVRPKPEHRCHVVVVEAKTVADLVASDPSALLAAAEEKDVRAGDGEKWLKYFLTAAEIEFMREVRRHSRVVELSRFARVDVGIVTGCNEWFVLRASEVIRRRLSGMTERLVSRSAHFRGATVSSDDWEALATKDERVHLVNIRRPDGENLKKYAAAYVAEGEQGRVHEGYKCSIRKPWFHVPSLWNPDAFLFRQIHDFPRFIRNGAGATSTDTIHRVTAHGCDPSALVASTFTHLTAASAEIEGRSYGGGVLELEPTEAERLLMPDALDAALPLAKADAMVRAGQLAALLEENDRRILVQALGFSASDCTRLKAIWAKLRDRRFSRGKRRTKAPS